MEKYVVEWRMSCLKPLVGVIHQADWIAYPYLSTFVTADMAVLGAEDAARGWPKGQYEFRVRHTTTEYINIEQESDHG